ncbi:putative selenium-dependent hydroxylase accessory protein YqeC [Desulfohalotomaculum tongense]|uniref:selenium cofactor biosynthesis protein YqeC n=1 Tax=Desulforadius tongensis TaxID=1216062 RepID=UPI00195892C9|nr:selenium cofactor biosynthesis protein YqeC [Desulforadius tongensis]MBM7855963.1 putative selenium-dependent hydroxylase accessory protein YqeC [Desulforadius tongensis]
MQLMKALALTGKEMVCFVGGGGKTSLMLKLARECAGSGKKVLITTSTKMYRRQLSALAEPVVERDKNMLLGRLKALLSTGSTAAAAAALAEDDKVIGLSGDRLDFIYRRGLFDYILVEADGARGKSLKAPGKHEPVLPSASTTVIPVTGVDILGCPLAEEYVHRSHLAAEIAGQNTGSVITERTVQKIIWHYISIISSVSGRSKIVPVINKADSSELIKRAVQTAVPLLNEKIKKVLVTSVLPPYYLGEVMQ